jgi:bifunctional non-homologous end joining protein LigD
MRVSTFIPPCLPSRAERPPSGPGWVHEIKHDGFRMMVRRDPDGVRLITRNGHDWTDRFPLIAQAAGALRIRSFLLDGEAVACDRDGMPSFDRLRYRRGDETAFLFAFDLLELNGDDLRREPLEVRKATLASVLAKAASGLRLNEHVEHDDGELVFRHACKLGLKGIVSKRKGSPYRAGRSPDWLKMKNRRSSRSAIHCCTECEWEEFLLPKCELLHTRGAAPAPILVGMEAIMPRSTTQLAIGAVIALGMAIVGLSATGTPLNVPQTLVIRDKPLLSETAAQVSDRERLQLRRYFNQERRDGLLR